MLHYFVKASLQISGDVIILNLSGLYFRLTDEWAVEHEVSSFICQYVKYS